MCDRGDEGGFDGLREGCGGVYVCRKGIEGSLPCVAYASVAFVSVA